MIKQLGNQDVYIVAGARTPIGRFGGSLSRHSLADLGSIAATDVLRRAEVEAEQVGSITAGNVMPTDVKDIYLSRAIGRKVGLSDSATAMNVNRLCGSGVQAIINSTLEIAAGVTDLSLAVGTESMSNAIYTVDGLRRGRTMGNGTTTDWLLGTLNCPFGSGHMGITAENIAKEHGISREDQDGFAELSQRRALEAIEAGAFKEEIVPVELQGREKRTFDTDEHPRATTAEDLAKLKPAFQEGGTVTAGNASGINDGAAAVLLAGEESVKKHSLRPMARIVSWGIAGVPPHLMGLGPIPAVPKALAAAGLELGDIGVIESNEAFAAQALAVSRELGFDPEIVNPLGGAIALGHPVGATGVILTVKALHHMKRNGIRYGLVTMCIGGGQGIALVVEAV